MFVTGSKLVVIAASAIALTSTLAGCTSEEKSQANVAVALLPGKGIPVYAAGDIADCRKFRPKDTGAAKTAALIETQLASDPNAAVLMLGDATYPVGLAAEFTNCYEPTWGRFKSRTYPTPGNHEYYTPQAKGYYGYFGDAAGPAQRGYYSFNLGKWHVISMNSYLKPDVHKVQLEWLKADLEKHKARCTLAFWHHPIYSSGGHGNNPQMEDAWKILAANNVELVLSAHDHHYERFAPHDGNGQRDDKRGIRLFVVGTGGARLTPTNFRKADSEVADSSSHGVLRLVLKDIGYEWEFLPVSDHGSADRGSAICH